ncbi:LemA family protein [Candidatus Saganbacteria bacterium]|nr:LemA family protein [Candidatus Saganbacteria bacterium]
MNKKLAWIIGIVALVLLCIMWVTGVYNNLVGLDQSVKESWAQVENQLQRRYDLIPNLVETVKGYAKHEKSTFEEITKARSAWANAQNMNQKVVAANGIESTIAKLFMVVENYPLLQAAPNFRALQDELAGTENRIAVERMRYNEKVQIYNTIAKRLPTVFFVRMFGFDGEKIFFKSAEPAKEAPKVKF